MEIDSDTERMASVLTIGRTYWILPCLEILCDIKSMERFVNLHSNESTDKLVRGYSLAIVLLFSWLLDTIVEVNPFDIGEDFAVSRAFQGEVPFERMPTDSDLGKLIRKIALLYTPLFRCDSLKELIASTEQIATLLLIPFRKAFEHSVELAPKAAERAGSDKRLCLRRLGVVNVHLFLCELKKVEIGFYFTFLRHKGHVRRTPPPEFYPGYKMAIAFLFENLLEPSSQSRALKLLMRSRSWKGLDNQYRTIQRDLVTPLEMEYGINDFIFEKFGKLSDELRSQLMFMDTPKMSTAYSTQEKLDNAFLWYDKKIVGEEGITFSSVAGVITALMGGLAIQREEPVRIRKFEHRVYHGSDFSFAVLVSAYSNIGNYSEWWVFPDFCNNVTGGGGSGYYYLTQFIERVRKTQGDRVEYRETQVDLKEFLRYVKAPSTHRPTRTLERDSALLGDARGWLLEMVTGGILRANGYKTFHRVRNSSILGDLEFDILGLRHEGETVRLLTAECSTRFSTEDVLRVKKKLLVLRNIWPQLLQHLKLPMANKVDLEGWLVTSEKVPASKKRVRSVRVLDSIEIERLASQDGIPWNKIRHVFGEEPRVVRMLYARGLDHIARMVEKERL